MLLRPSICETFFVYLCLPVLSFIIFLAFSKNIEIVYGSFTSKLWISLRKPLAQPTALWLSIPAKIQNCCTYFHPSLKSKQSVPNNIDIKQTIR